MVLLGFRGVQALDVVGPFEVFTGATLQLAAMGRSDDGYAPVLAAADGGPVTTLTGLEFVTKPPPDPNEPIDTIVLPGGMGVDEARADPAVVDWIRTTAPHAARVASVCVGAHVLAAAGLLDGRTATTGVTTADQLAAHFAHTAKNPGWVEVQWSKPTGAALDQVVERLKALKLTLRNVPMDAAPADGVCLFTGEPAVERVLVARAY